MEEEFQNSDVVVEDILVQVLRLRACTINPPAATQASLVVSSPSGSQGTALHSILECPLWDLGKSLNKEPSAGRRGSRYC